MAHPVIGRRLAFVAVLAMSGIAHAQPQPVKFAGRLVGIYDDRTGAPIDSAEVRDMMSGSSALTTNTGTLSLFFVDTAGSLLRIRKLGYSPITIFVENAPDLTPLTITLEPIAQLLPTVLSVDVAPKYVGPGLRGFEERRKTRMGYFIPEATLRKENDRTLANVIRAHVPSIEIREVILRSRRIMVASSRRGRPCAVDVYLDGMPYSIASGSAPPGTAIPGTGNSGGAARAIGGANDPADLNEFQVHALAAVEFHNIGDTPPEFNRTGSGCGVLLLWTREK